MKAVAAVHLTSTNQLNDQQSLSLYCSVGLVYACMLQMDIVDLKAPLIVHLFFLSNVSVSINCAYISNYFFSIHISVLCHLFFFSAKKCIIVHRSIGPQCKLVNITAYSLIEWFLQSSQEIISLTNSSWR